MKPRLICLILLPLLSILLAACGGSEWVPAAEVPTRQVSPTASPSPTLASETPAQSMPVMDVTLIPETETVAPTASPTGTFAPTITDTPQPPEAQLATLLAEWNGTGTPGAVSKPGSGPRATSTRPPTRTPTITPTPTITSTPVPPFAVLRIAKPGILSKVISPINAEMLVMPGEDGQLQIDLIGEDGREITRQLLDYRRYSGKNIGIFPHIPFQINAVGEAARLVVSANDRFGRKMWLTSVELVLLSIGENEITPPMYQQEPYLIREPKPAAVLSGGSVRVNALARPVNKSPLIFELIDEKGVVVGSTSIQVADPIAPLSHTPFTIEIPYKITEITPVRLTVRQASDMRIPGNVALYSMEVILAP